MLYVLPDGCCGLAAAARILRYLARQGAQQCGPCRFGLPAIAADLEQLAAARLCADLLPERISLDEWGFPIISGDVPPGLAAHARRAVRACPVLALRLTRAGGARGTRSA
ncbi:MAG TPA: ferredoxin [Streptosporangiaceae bacterium]|nr:ferredoxin [Streptosporangiaceae bacterium]